MSQQLDFTQTVSPESLGISSRAILRFLDQIRQQRVCLHGFILARNSQIAAEGYWAPFTENRMHRMYSVSKSFVSLAIGLLIDQNKLHLDDLVCPYFKDKLPEQIDPYLKQTTIRDLLMMASPHSENAYTRSDPDWAWTFFNKKPSHPPGSIFAYDTAATVILNTIVERISGMPFLDFMRPGLLDPIGFSKNAWCIQTPEGSSWGGSGVICTLRDMSRIASVCLNRGRWGSRQLVSDEYVTAATSRQIDNSIGFGNQGYGYQIWRVKENGFAFIGMGGQLAYCFPDKNFQFTCIADTQGIGPTGTGIVDAMYQEIHSTLSDQPLPQDPEGLATLTKQINSLSILPQAGTAHTITAEMVSGTWYKLRENPMNISSLRVILEDDHGCLEYKNAQGHQCLDFGIGQMLPGKFPQKNYFGSRIGTVPGTAYDCLASAAWVEADKLNILVYIIDDYLGNMQISLSFRDSQISVFMTKTAEWFLDEYNGFAGGVLE